MNDRQWPSVCIVKTIATKWRRRRRKRDIVLSKYKNHTKKNVSEFPTRKVNKEWTVILLIHKIVGSWYALFLPKYWQQKKRATTITMRWNEWNSNNITIKYKLKGNICTTDSWLPLILYINHLLNRISVVVTDWPLTLSLLCDCNFYFDITLFLFC